MVSRATFGLRARVRKARARLEVKPETRERIKRRVFRLFKGYAPHAKQRALHESGARYLAVCAGRRSGKTYALTREFVRRVYRDFNAALEEVKRGEREAWRRPTKLATAKPFLQYWVVAPTYALCDTASGEIFDVLGGVDGDRVINFNTSTRKLWLKGGILIQFKSADRPERLVSVGLNGMLIDEAARLKRDVWVENLEPTLGDYDGWCLFATTPLGQNWFYQDIWQLTQHGTDPKRRHPEFCGFHFTTMDNTARPNVARAALLAKDRVPLASWLRNYAADFNSFEGKIFEEFLDDSTHVVTSVPARFKRLVAGVDWGYRNPGAIIVGGFDGDDTIHIIAEEYQTELTIPPPINDPTGDCWVNRVVSWARRGVEVFYCDPSEPEHMEQLRAALVNAGYEHVLVVPALNAVRPGIQALQTYLKPVEFEGALAPGLYIHTDCANLRRELVSYQWGRDELPKKEDDHSVDALRYLVYSEHKMRRGGLRRLDNFDLYADVR